MKVQIDNFVFCRVDLGMGMEIKMK